jgi:choline dehydrogenase
MSVQDFTSKSYDYIICGGGTAGLVFAARLTEDPHITVGVVEAGGNGLDDLLIDSPNLFLQLYGKPQYDWAYNSVPQVCFSGSGASKTQLTNFPGGNRR